MAEIPVDILEKVRKFIEVLEKNNYRIIRAYLYGSWASGNSNEWSDIDLALVSDDF